MVIGSFEQADQALLDIEAKWKEIATDIQKTLYVAERIAALNVFFRKVGNAEWKCNSSQLICVIKAAFFVTAFDEVADRCLFLAKGNKPVKEKE